jgi:hypothetical protein
VNNKNVEYLMMILLEHFRLLTFRARGFVTRQNVDQSFLFALQFVDLRLKALVLVDKGFTFLEEK